MSSSDFGGVGPNTWLVASSNVTVIVSPAPNTASPPSGSSATTLTKDGPGAVPNVPLRNGDTAVDASDVLPAFLKLPDALTINCMAPTCGGVSTVASSIVISKVLGFSHSPL